MAIRLALAATPATRRHGGVSPSSSHRAATRNAAKAPMVVWVTCTRKLVLSWKAACEWARSRMPPAAASTGETSATPPRDAGPLHAAEPDHQSGGHPVLQPLGVDLGEAGGPERPRALIGGGAQVHEAGEGQGGPRRVDA